MKRPLLLLIVLLPFVFSQNAAWARRHHHRRRHHHIKGLFFANQILKLDGTMTVNGKPVLEYSGVKPGDLLETGDKSTAVVRISGLALFEMGPGTKLKLTRITDRTDTKFEIMSGRALCLFRHPGVHQILLPHSTLVLHGTTLYIEAGPGDDDADKVCLCDGKLQANVADDDDDDVPKSKPAKTGKPRKPDSDGNVAVASPAANAAPSASASAAAAPAPVAAATPSPTPSLPQQMEFVSHNEHKQFEINDDGIVVKDEKLLDLHSDKEIQDMESLYNLP